MVSDILIMDSRVAVGCCIVWHRIVVYGDIKWTTSACNVIIHSDGDDDPYDSDNDQGS